MRGDWLLPALIAFFCWGLWAFLPKLTIRFMDPRSAVVFESLGGILVGLGVWALLGHKLAGDPRGIALGIFTGMLGVIGALAYLYSIQKGPIILVSTVTALYPVVAVALASVLLGESINLRQGLGIVFGLVAIVLIVG